MPVGDPGVSTGRVVTLRDVRFSQVNLRPLDPLEWLPLRRSLLLVVGGDLRDPRVDVLRGRLRLRPPTLDTRGWADLRLDRRVEAPGGHGEEVGDTRVGLPRPHEV